VGGSFEAAHICCVEASHRVLRGQKWKKSRETEDAPRQRLLSESAAMTGQLEEMNHLFSGVTRHLSRNVNRNGVASSTVFQFSELMTGD
jgi:hypothetical protein